VRPVIRNGAGTNFLQGEYGSSKAWEVAGITGDPGFPSGTGQGREASATGSSAATSRDGDRDPVHRQLPVHLTSTPAADM
jgi:hypothetical protein